MMLVPFSARERARAESAFARALREDARALAVFRRVMAASPDVRREPVETHHARALDLLGHLGIPTIHEAPSRAFSWDGRAVRVASEPSVVVHEAAHWLLCPPERRTLPDFGLGAGPETGFRAEAETARMVDDETRWEEEAQASLLGILWEERLGLPALSAFLEQNWLVDFERPFTPVFFQRTLGALALRGLIDDRGFPTKSDHAPCGKI